VRAIYFGHGDSITVGANIVLNESLENIRRANGLVVPRIQTASMNVGVSG
jgi:hypothetical protein